MNRPGHKIQFILDDQLVSLDFQEGGLFHPDTSLLQYLRKMGHTSVKEGCGEGDCGACTVVMAELIDDKLIYKAMNACLVFLPMIHGCQVITTENLSYRKEGQLHLHPVQQALVDHHGSQCGYCTPGIVMSLFAIWKNQTRFTPSMVREKLAGNLCRCTGYQPIIDAIMGESMKGRHDLFTESSAEVVKTLAGIRRQKEDLEFRTPGMIYLKPATLKTALKLRASYPDAVIISGATDIGVAVNKRKQKLHTCIDLNSVDELKSANREDDHFHIGSCISIEALGEKIQEDFPALHDMIMVFGSHQIRNLASPGGNIAGASPIGDLPPILMAYDCKVELQSPGNKRSIPLEEFITGYHTTKLGKDELLTALLLPYPVRDRITRAYKVSKRKDVDISTVSAGFSIQLSSDEKIKEISLFYGGMAATTLRASRAEDFLKGRAWDEQVVIEASEIIRQEFEPISDARSSADSRRIMAGNLLIRFWEDTVNKEDGSKR